MKIYDSIAKKKAESKKQFAVLVDPDKPSNEKIISLAKKANEALVDYIFVGGSLLTTNTLDACIKLLKAHTNIPIVLFPGNTLQMSYKADAILFLSLISGRNPEMLIGRHVISAPYIKLSGLEVISVGYMLVDSGKPTSVTYMSGSHPIPYDKDDIAACTAMAGEMLGLKLIFLDAGSGAEKAISKEMIELVSGSIDVPLIVGGGIRTTKKAIECAKAGADLIIVGNHFETDPDMILKMADAIHAI